MIEHKNLGKSSMNFWTALTLSFNNLLTKKGRTALTSFAGSIGIIGIALILAISTGVQNYIDEVQQDTLSSFPIQIEKESTDMSALLNSLMGGDAEGNKDELKKDREGVYGNPVMYKMMKSMLNAEVSTNNLENFKVALRGRIRSTQGLRQHVFDTAKLKNRTNRTTGDQTGTGGCRTEQNPGATEFDFDFVGQSLSVHRNLDEITAGRFATLTDSI